jgi:integrase
MATIESIDYTPREGAVETSPTAQRAMPENRHPAFPQIMWADGTPWREANLWAIKRLRGRIANTKTIWSEMKHVRAYALWLEQENVSWWDFPTRAEDRCLIRFRGHLIYCRDEGILAPSTVKQRMGAVIRFYRWLEANRIIDTNRPLWKERTYGIHLVDDFGFKRTLSVSTTDLSIPNRKLIGSTLEEGLLPIPTADVADILNFSKKNASPELYLFLYLGFWTGMRFGTIADLKIDTIVNAPPNPRMPGFHLLAVGPAAKPSVHTKFGVSGQISISAENITLIKEYIYSTRRLNRVILSRAENQNLVFLNRFGRGYGTEGSNSSRGISVELGRLRKAASNERVNAFKNFHFHQTRCTFATELARLSLPYGISFALKMVKESLLHKDETTSLNYIKFVEDHLAMAELSNEFTAKMLGLVKGKTS